MNGKNILKFISIGCIFMMLFICYTSYYFDNLFDNSLNQKASIANNRQCQCKSLFTIGGCDLDSYVQKSSLSNWWKRSVVKLKYARKGMRGYTILDILNNLARFLPYIYQKESMTNTSEKNKIHEAVFTVNSSTDYYKNHHNEVAIADYTKLATNMPHVPCNVHIYNTSDIKTCLVKRRKTTGQPLRIAFIGDSVIRSLLEGMTIHLREDLNLQNGEDSGKNLTTDFLDINVKTDWPIFGHDLEMKLHWSTHLRREREEAMSTQGALDILQSWAQGKPIDNETHIPDIIYLDDGMWRFYENYETETIDIIRNDYQQMFETFKDVEKYSKIFMRIHPSLKEYAASHLIENQRLEFNNELAFLILQETGIWMWDTLTVFYIKEVQECRNLWKTGFGKNLPRAWMCQDLQHPSKMVERIAENMLWNYVCNGIMKLDNSHCCSMI